VYKKGYYYICGDGSVFGALFTASFGDSYDGVFNYAKIYQYIPRKDISLYEAEQLYHSSSLHYEDGLYYHLINEGSVDQFRHELHEYLTSEKKKFPDLL